MNRRGFLALIPASIAARRLPKLVSPVVVPRYVARTHSFAMAVPPELFPVRLAAWEDVVRQMGANCRDSADQMMLDVLSRG